MQEEEDVDNARLPRTFPIRDVGQSTPGTTYLDEPPEGLPPPPPYIPGFQNMQPQYTNSENAILVSSAARLSCDTATSLCRSIDLVQRQAVALRGKLAEAMEEQRHR